MFLKELVLRCNRTLWGQFLIKICSPKKCTPFSLNCLGLLFRGKGLLSVKVRPIQSNLRLLQYLQGHSQPDISFAVSQISQYTFGPKRSHELALEQIGRYLKGTIEKGLILKPNLTESEFKIDVYVDAAFASGWGTELGTNPDSVKSQTGFIIEVMGCSVIWCSKLQPCIATSTIESKYTALSMALRAAIPLLDVTKSINDGLRLIVTRLLTFKATVHEDNMGALRLAQLEPGQHTPRSKFYALKLHWFRS
jgi:hypothetical protein